MNNNWTHIYGILSAASIIVALLTYRAEWGLNPWAITGWVLAFGYLIVIFQLNYLSRKDSIKIGSSTVQIAEYENKLENQEKSHNDKIEILERHYKEKLEVLREDSREKIDAITNTANFLASTNFRQLPTPRTDSTKE